MVARSFLVLCLVLLPLAGRGDVVVKKQNKRLYRVTFRYQPVIAVKSVALAGTFNGWRKDADVMKESAGTSVYETTLLLPAGKYQYKFVLNGETWIRDPGNSDKGSDGNGGENSILWVGRRPAVAEGKVGDGKIDGDQIVHDPSDLAHACAVDGDRRIILRLHVLKRDVERVYVVVDPAPSELARVAMERIARVDGRDVYEARLLYKDVSHKTLRYHFEIEDGRAVAKLGRSGLGSGRPRFQLVVDHAGRFETPDWVRDAIFYQIFPDRFRNADPGNDEEGIATLKRRPKGQPWSIHDAYLEDWSGRPSYNNFFGGDLRGVEEKLDYLASLGVNAIYLNPIFRAASNHRYDAADFDRVDERLGTEADFKRLCASAKKRGIKVMLDAVFNHTGDRHYAFEDIKAKGKASKFFDWYFIESLPVRRSPKPSYKCWWNFASLPQLNTAKREVIDHLMKVSVKWLDSGAAGWRLDVPNEVDAINPEFWPEFRRIVRAAHPDSYILGEIWTAPKPWLGGDKFDATMNYELRNAVIEFLVKRELDAEGFAEKCAALRARLPEPALRVQFNLLGSHDTARFRKIAGERLPLVRLAYGFLFGTVGAPVVYYGDEVGVSGGKDPACRRTFPWDEAKQDKKTREWIARLGQVRRTEPALRRGVLRPRFAKERILAFERVPDEGDEGRRILVVMNAGEKAGSLELPDDFGGAVVIDLLGVATEIRSAGGKLRLSLPALSVCYLAAKASDG